MRTRNHRFSVWMNDTEFKHLASQAEKTGLKKEQVIRKLIMGLDVHPRPPDNAAALLKAINEIGNNINQIARKVNIYDDVTKDDLSEIKSLLTEIYREIKEQ